jgi:flavin reductase (DIM6/NTAB) family NADH-FMN oxidoreductase RutF
MKKEFWKPGNMLYPLPAVMVSCQRNDEKPNIITIAWTGTICTNPPMVYVSIRPGRHSYDIIKESGEFVINLSTKELARAVDYCGVRSGRDVDKFKEMKLNPINGNYVKAPLIEESPVNIECKLTQIVQLGSHDMFMGEVLGVHVNPNFLNEKGKFELSKSEPIVYSHGEYYGLGDLLGTFGYSVKKQKKR